jgi:hypothetical protein
MSSHTITIRSELMKSLVLRRLAILMLICIAATAGAVGAGEPRVYVVLWFDTEDYLLPADDDATLQVSRFLTSEGIRCTHKLVGEKARVLERRGRTDVLEALNAHEIGYHSDYHSVQPTPALYMSRQGWDDGVLEFHRRERQGMLDVQRITGQKPTCYGQPGSSWGPQQFGAMREWDMPIYLDAGSHVRLDGGPFWYCGILNLYALKATLRTNLGGPQDLEQAKQRFSAARMELLEKGGGLVSIYYHPCEFVHKQFWDGVNFMRGANPPRDEWKIPPQKTPEESRIAFETFEGYIRFIKSHPDVQFVTATEALRLYRDTAQQHDFGNDEVQAIADSMQETVSFCHVGSMTLAASEQLVILNEFVRQRAGGRGDGPIRLTARPFGPSQPPLAHEATSATLSQFTRTVDDVADYIERHGRVPNAVWLGSTPISPESYLVSLGATARTILQANPLPDTLEFKPANLASAQYVSDDDPKLWGWVIFPPGFRAPEMMQLAKRQAWTLKPAILAPE